MANSSDAVRRRGILRRLAGLCAAILLVVTTVSAYIRLSGAGLGCEDWPRCYGQATAHSERAAAADPAGTVVARLLHRVAAVIVLILVVVIAYVCIEARTALRVETRIAFALIALVLFLTVLGRWTTGARLPAVALGNLLGGFGMLALLWWLRLRAGAFGSSLRFRQDAGTNGWARVGIFVLLVQITLGGQVSASYSALACVTLPDCQGAWWPPGGTADAFNPWREPSAPAALAGASAEAALHMAHRAFALLAATVSIGAALRGIRAGGRHRSAGILLLGLVVAQVALGAAAVAGGLPLLLVVAHNVVAALLLLTLVTLAHRPATA
jgi:cytochrome c oxidase assembly protein subunit 15